MTLGRDEAQGAHQPMQEATEEIPLGYRIPLTAINDPLSD